MKAFNKVIAVLLLSVSSISCKKERKDVLPTPDMLLHGKWSITHFVWDMNSNEMLDEEEIESAEQNGDFAIAFDPNGTGYTSHKNNVNFKTNTQPFVWELIGEKEIRIITTNSVGRDTGYTRINKLTMDSCILERADNYASLDWRIMVKQKQ